MRLLIYVTSWMGLKVLCFLKRGQQAMGAGRGKESENINYGYS